MSSEAQEALRHQAQALVDYAKTVVMSPLTVLLVSRGDTARIDVDSERSA